MLLAWHRGELETEGLKPFLITSPIDPIEFRDTWPEQGELLAWSLAYEDLKKQVPETPQGIVMDYTMSLFERLGPQIDDLEDRVAKLQERKKAAAEAASDLEPKPSGDE